MTRSTLSSRNRPSLLLVKSTDATGDFLSKKLFVKISQYSQENTCAKSLLNKVAGHKVCNFIKKRLQHRFFSINIGKFLKTPVLKNIWVRLVLKRL